MGTALGHYRDEGTRAGRGMTGRPGTTMTMTRQGEKRRGGGDDDTPPTSSLMSNCSWGG